MMEWTVNLDGKEFTLKQLRDMTDEELSDFIDRLCADNFDAGVTAGHIYL